MRITEEVKRSLVALEQGNGDPFCFFFLVIQFGQGKKAVNRDLSKGLSFQRARGHGRDMTWFHVKLKSGEIGQIYRFCISLCLIYFALFNLLIDHTYPYIDSPYKVLVLNLDTQSLGAMLQFTSFEYTK